MIGNDVIYKTMVKLRSSNLPVSRRVSEIIERCNTDEEVMSILSEAIVSIEMDNKELTDRIVSIKLTQSDTRIFIATEENYEEIKKNLEQDIEHSWLQKFKNRLQNLWML